MQSKAEQVNDGQATRPIEAASFDVERIRKDFPILSRTVNGKPLVYLDNAATTQKPSVVTASICHLHESTNANIHRGVHRLSIETTQAYEKARLRVARFIGAASETEIIFVRGATEAINLVAQSFGRPNLIEGDEIIVSNLEHHANIVPWQILCEQTGARLRVVPVDDDGNFLLDEYQHLLTQKTKIVAILQGSNALGTVVPVHAVTRMAHEYGAKVLIDGAQAVQHHEVDVRSIDCDFYVFSGHKMYAPSGIGILYAKEELLDAMPPYQGGGEMIKSVTFEQTIYNDLPHKFEAGTPNIEGAIGLGAAIEYLENVGLSNIAAYEDKLLDYATTRLAEIPEVRLIGTAKEKVSVVSFVVEGIHPHDIGTVLDQEGVAIRTGHHCAQPIMQRFGVPATARASMSFYNTHDEIDRLIDAIHTAIGVFA
ncbi:MAG: cysteine desulfurase [Planctomycetes bacterium]|nr:cysteine desulfurase [Planctomycetota bacterium]